MAQQIINIGSSPNDGNGDPIRTAYNKCNSNFTELYSEFVTAQASGSNSYTATPSPVFSFSQLKKILLKFPTGSTGLCTLDVSSLGAKKIYIDPTTQAGNGDITANGIYILVYDSTLDSANGGFLIVGGVGGGGAGAFTDLSDVPNSYSGQANKVVKVNSGATALEFGDVITDALVFKGVIDCSSNPNYPAADAGHTYKVSVAGKIGGASGPNVEVGDLLLCTVDSSASGDHAAVGANWTIQQVNTDGAVTGPSSATANAVPRYDGTTGKVIKNSGVTIDDSNVVTAANVLATGQAAASSLKNLVYIDDTGKIWKAAWVELDTTNQKTTSQGVDDLEATVLEEWLNDSGDYIMRIVNGRKVLFGGTSSFLEVQAGISSGNAGIIFLDDLDIAYRLKDEASFDYLVCKSSDSGYGKAFIINQNQVNNHKQGFETVRRQFKLTTATTAAATEVVGSISVPSGYALSVHVLRAQAITSGGRMQGCEPFSAIGTNVSGTTSGSSTTPTALRITATTGGFSVVWNNTDDRADISFTNETGTGYAYDVLVDVEYILYQLPV